VTDSDPGVPNHTPSWDTLFRWALMALVVSGFTWAVGDRWSEVRHSIDAVPAFTLIAAWAVATVGLVGPWRAWDAIVKDLGTTLPAHASAEIFFVGQLGKYLPGAVWPVILQMRMSRSVGLPRTRVAVSFVITLIVGVSTGLLVGALAMPALMGEPRHRGAWLVLGFLPFAVIALHPRVLGGVARGLLRLTRRPVIDVQLSSDGVRHAVAGTCFFWVVGGIHLGLLAIALGSSAGQGLAVGIGALALAVSLGPLFVVLPAGVGVREAVLVAALTTVLPTPDAVAAALLSRAILVLGDGTLAIAAFLYARHRS
jgi:uncharacterized membrane protein YbhN (UPF0104 family)